MYHGTSSGHLSIFVNQQIMLIDFGVFDSKSFSFFIEDDLCHIRLVRKKDRMYYYFEIDKEAPTGANQRRRKALKKAWKGTLLFLATLLVAVFLFALYAQIYKKRQKEAARMFMQMDTTTGIILSLPEYLPGSVTYEFIPRGQDVYYRGRYYLLQEAEDGEYFISSHQAGDSCRVRYRILRPQFNSLIVE